MTKEERDAKREEIRRQTEEFLKKGGKVEKVPVGKCSDVDFNRYVPKDDDII